MGYCVRQWQVAVLYLQLRLSPLVQMGPIPLASCQAQVHGCCTVCRLGSVVHSCRALSLSVPVLLLRLAWPMLTVLLLRLAWYVLRCRQVGTIGGIGERFETRISGSCVSQWADTWSRALCNPKGGSAERLIAGSLSLV